MQKLQQHLQYLNFMEQNITRKDMNLGNEYPDLKQILLAIKSNQDFDSKYIKDEDKKYFLQNKQKIQSKEEHKHY